MAAAAVDSGGTAAVRAPLVEHGVACCGARARVVCRGGGDRCAARRVVVVLRGGWRTDELDVSETVSARRVAFEAGGSGKPLLIEASVPPWADGGVSPRRPAIVVACDVLLRVQCVSLVEGSAGGTRSTRSTPW